MKTKLCICLVLSVSLLVSSCKKPDPPATGAGIPCVPQNLQASVIAFYPFTNGNTNDFSGKNHHLSNTHGVVAAADRTGNPNCAFELIIQPGRISF